MENEKRQVRPALLILFALFLVILAVLGFLSILPRLQKADTYPVFGSEDWMAEIPDERLLSDVAVPGTHDSATQYVQLAYFSKCQSLSIAEQLAAGYRYLDIRLAEDGENLKLVHGFTNCKSGNAVWSKNLLLPSVLSDCAAFLREHPTECILFAVKKEDGAGNIAAFQGLLSDALTGSGIPLLEISEIPTMGEARGKLVLLRRYEDELGLGESAGIPLLFPEQSGHGNTDLSYEDTKNGSYTLRVQDRFEFAANDKWVAFSKTLQEELPEEGLVLNFLSTKGTAKFGHPYRFAKKLNKKLMNAELSEYPGLGSGMWVIVDFGSPRLAEKIWRVNFPAE